MKFLKNSFHSKRERINIYLDETIQVLSEILIEVGDIGLYYSKPKKEGLLRIDFEIYKNSNYNYNDTFIINEDITEVILRCCDYADLRGFSPKINIINCSRMSERSDCHFNIKLSEISLFITHTTTKIEIIFQKAK